MTQLRGKFYEYLGAGVYTIYLDANAANVVALRRLDCFKLIEARAHYISVCADLWMPRDIVENKLKSLVLEHK